MLPGIHGGRHRGASPPQAGVPMRNRVARAAAGDRDEDRGDGNLAQQGEHRPDVEHVAADKAADQRSDPPDQDGAEDADLLTPGQHETGEPTDDRPDKRRADQQPQRPSGDRQEDDEHEQYHKQNDHVPNVPTAS